MAKFKMKSIGEVRVAAVSKSVTINFQSDKGQNHSIEMPMDALAAIAAEAQRGRLSFETNQSVGPLRTSGTMQELATVEPEEMDVVDLPLSPTPTIALVFDKNTQRQMAFRMPAQAALQVADKIREIAETSMTPAVRQ